MTAPLTAAERALAPMLAAWDAWPDAPVVYGDPINAILRDLSVALHLNGMADGGSLTDAGRDLVARWQAEREARIDERVQAMWKTAAPGVYAAPWFTLSAAEQERWRAIVRAVDASGGGR